MLAGAVGGIDPVGDHGEREVAVGDHPDGPTAVADDHRPDVAVAHQLADPLQAVVDLGGHDALRHHLGDAHGRDCIARCRAGAPARRATRLTFSAYDAVNVRRALAVGASGPA